MNKKGNEFETLLADLDEKNYNSLINFQQLKVDGWQIHYVIDADLIGNYCFPEGIVKSRVAKDRDLTDEYIMDEQATLYNVFKSNWPAPQGIILDEYVLELRGMTRVALAAEKTLSSEADKFVNKWLAKSREQDYTDLGFRELTDDIKNNFSLRLAEVLFGINGLKKFQSLLSLDWIKFESADNITEFFHDLFDEEKGDPEEVKKIYNLFSEMNLHFNFNSKSRDSKAIQRIIAINRNIQKNFERHKNKKILVFVIDAPSGTQEVFKRLYESDTIEYPLIQGKRVPLFTTIQEIFAHLICKVTTEDEQEDFSSTLTNLESLKKISGRILKQIPSASGVSKILRNENVNSLLTGQYQNFFLTYKSIRNSFENTGLFENMNHIYGDIKELLKDRKTPGLINYFNEVKIKEKKLLEEFKNRTKFLDDLVDEFDFNSIFIAGIEEIHRNQTSWEWSKGLDPIEGTYHILPVFFKLRNYKEYARELNKVIRLVLGDEKKNDIKIYEALKNLIEILRTVKSKQEYLISQRLLKALLFLILPGPKRVSGKKKIHNKDEKVYEWLISVGDNHEPLYHYEADYLYVLCWVTRRTKEYSKSIKYAVEGKKKYPDDPRFYHGYALGKYCKIFGDERATPSEYDEIIKNISLSESLYEKFFAEHYSENDIKLYMEKIESSNNNSICVFLTEKALILLNKDDDYESALKCLTQARKRINLLKSDSKYKIELPEYYDTEAALEFAESFMFEDFSPTSKLRNALGAIKVARSLTSNPELIEKYSERGAEIEKRLDDMTNQKL